MATQTNVIGFEINPKLVGALFTEQMDDVLRVFCFYLNGEVANFEMPALENLDSLRHFFSSLKMEETCSSMIMDQMIQSRFYVQSQDKYWLYTLLANSGKTLPTGSADIFNLPWQVCWRSQEAEILQYASSSRTPPCYAIRTAISEDDAHRLVKQSKAFTRPVIIRKKTSPRRLIMASIAGLLVLGLTTAIGLSLAAHQKSSPPPAAAAPVAPPVKPVAKAAITVKYYLLDNHHITGPYTADSIADMKASGLLKPDTMCRAENATEWASLDSVLPSLTSR